MVLFTTPQLVAGTLAAAAGLVGAYAAYGARRAARRAAEGRCARCGATSAARYPSVGRALVGGREVCEPCATSLRVRAVRGAALAAGTVGVVAAAIAASNGYDVLQGNIPFRWGLFSYWLPPAGVLGGIAAVALHRLKRANRAALAVPDRPPELTAPALAWAPTPKARAPVERDT
jgi:hypothetical protein